MCIMLLCKQNVEKNGQQLWFVASNEMLIVKEMKSKIDESHLEECIFYEGNET